MPVKDNITSDEIMKIAEKVRQNEKETESFKKSLALLLAGDKSTASKPLTIGTTTNALSICGANESLPITITKKVVEKAMNPELRDNDGNRLKKSGHFLSESQLITALNDLKNPTMILKGNRPDTLIAVTELKDDRGQEIIVPIELNKAGDVSEVNAITSVYGRENFVFFMEENIKRENVLAVNTEKANEMLLSIGVDYPKANTFISFDNSIAYSKANVKYPEKPVPEQTHYKEIPSYNKLLPFLNAKAEYHEMRLASLKSKRDTRVEKITRNETKIAKLNERVQRLEDINKALNLIDNFPAVKSVIERNKSRIDTINTKKIPNRESKIFYHKSKIAEIDHRAVIITHKLERAVALSDTVKSFALIGRERRERFADAVDKLNASTLACLNDRKNELSFEIDKNTSLYNSSLTAAEDKLDIQNKISKLQVKLENVESKISRLSLRSSMAQKSEIEIDSSMDNAADRINETLAEGTPNIPDLSEMICISDSEDKTLERSENSLDSEPTISVRGHFLVPEFENKLYTVQEFNKTLAKANERWQGNDDNEGRSAKIKLTVNLGDGEKHECALPMEANFERLSDFLKYDDVAGIHDKILNAVVAAEKSNYLENTEIEMEENYNNIDGVLNNLPTNNKEMNELPENSKKIAGIVYENKSGDQLWDDVTDYYHTPDNTIISEFTDGWYEKKTYTQVSADELMEQLNKAGDPYNVLNARVYKDLSAEDNAIIFGTAVNVVNWLDTLIKEGKAEILDNGKLKINQDYYFSLNKADRNVNEFSRHYANSIMEELSKQGIPFSAVSRDNGNIAITVSKDDNDKLNSILGVTVSQKEPQHETKAEKIHSEYYKSLPAAERVTNTIPESNARNIMTQLEEKNVPFSAVHKGDSYKITVSKENEKALNAAVRQSETKYINPEYYTALDKNDRFTQRMSEQQAKQVVKELDSKGIEHSAVINGKNSAVTISQHDIKKAKDVRGFLKKQAQRIHNSQSKQTEEKSKDKGVSID